MLETEGEIYGGVYRHAMDTACSGGWRREEETELEKCSLSVEWRRAQIHMAGVYRAVVASPVLRLRNSTYYKVKLVLF
jgi:hypothetical protein